MRTNTTKICAALLGMCMLATNADAQMVISKVFYAGTTKAGATTNYTGGEEYIELHNNSASEYNISGLMIGLVESESTTGAYYAKDRESGFEIKLKQLYQIPEDKDYIVQPWGNVVIAACAMDHSTLTKGGADLSKADFSFGGMNGDSESVTKLNLLFSFNDNTKAVNLTNGGDAGIVIIKKNYASMVTYADESTYVFANGKTSGSKYLPFNAYFAMDVVEILKTKATDGVYSVDPERKRFSETQDKGYVPATEKMNKDGFIAYRKTALNCDGNKYLYDTNNSSCDFAISNTIAVNEYDDEESGTTEVNVTIPESGFLPFNAEKAFFCGSDLYVGYVSISSNVVKCNSVQGNTTVFSSSPYLLIGAPGTHTIKYTEAARLLSIAGQNNWIADGDSKYADGVLTVTTKNRYPMKFVNDGENPRFVRDAVNNNPQTLKIDVASEGRLYINLNYLNEEETAIKWNGIMPKDFVSTGIECINKAAVTADDKVYDLRGMKVGTVSSDIIIKGGKKYLVK